MKIAGLILVSVLTLSGCDKISFGQPNISGDQRLLIVCEAWDSVFARIDTRDYLGMATEAEVKAIDTALPILNPICTSDLSIASGFDIRTLEAALLTVLTAQEKPS